MEENKIKLLGVTVHLKDCQMRLGEDGTEYWEITFDGQKFLNAERKVTYYSAIEIDPSNRVKHEEIDYINIDIIRDGE